MFFPQKNDLAKGNEAIKLCMECPVFFECREYRKATGSKYGIWAAEYTKRNEKDDD